MRLFPLLAPVLLHGCADFVDILKTSACIMDNNVEVCEAGEAVGTLNRTPNPHCCEAVVFEKRATCSVGGDQQTALAGFFGDYLKLSSDTLIEVDVSLRERMAVHRYDRAHCPAHPGGCDPSLNRKEWLTTGRVRAYERVELSAEKLQELAAALSAPGSASAAPLLSKPVQIDVNGQSVDATEITSAGSLASLCLQVEHDSCPPPRQDPRPDAELWRPRQP